MKVTAGYISVGIFVIGAISYYLSIFLIPSQFPSLLMALLTIVLPIIGLLVSLADKGNTKIIGLGGNFLVLLFALIIPGFTMIFLN